VTVRTTTLLLVLLVIVASGCSGGAHRDAAPMRSAAPKPSFVVDLTWISDRSGWALSGRHCGSKLCPELARTRDGGRTWRRLPDPPGSLDARSHVRFANASDGYLFGPALFVTHDGGRTWTRETSPPVESLEPSGGSVVRLVYDHTGCPGPCNRTVQEAPAGSAAWRTLVRLGIPAADSREPAAQVIRGGGGLVYVPIYGSLAAGAGTQHTILFRSRDGGGSWSRLRDPCAGRRRGVHDAVSVAAAPGGVLVALCVPRMAGPGGRFALVSTNAGSTWSAHRPVPGSPWLVAAASAAHLVVADGPISGEGKHTYRLAASADAGRHWRNVVTDRERLDPAAPGSAFLGFEDARVGRWVGWERTIWTTHDAGLHWARSLFPAG
jgi:photosystem II stability/assembly factor-like uncharacterized protein